MYADRDGEHAVIWLDASELATLAGAISLVTEIGEDLGFDIQSSDGLLTSFKDAILVFNDDEIIDTILEDHPRFDTPEVREKIRANLGKRRERAGG